MIEAVISGIGIGLILTFITGPVFFALVKTSIERGFHAGIYMALGVVCSDVVFVGAILFGSQLFEVSTQTKTIAGIIGSVILFGIGIHYIFKKADVDFKNPTPKRIKRAGFFLKGFLMCLLSPTTLMFWVMVGGIISVQLHYDMAEKVVFFILAMTTQLTVDGFKTYYAAKLRYRIKEKTIQNLNRIAGAVILIFAIRLFIEVFIKYHQTK
jgi:threonine/homoserine/homoserine lactone efflux protein